MKRKFVAVLLVVALALSLALPVGVVSAHTEDDPQVQTLYAGQNMDVGTVSVWNDGENLYVKYELNEEAIEEGWIITETHLYAGKTNPNILTSAPGQFPYDDGDAESVTDTVVTYEIPLAGICAYKMQLNKQGKPTGVMIADGAPGVVPCNDVYIAAHAVVERTETGTFTPDLTWQRSTETDGEIANYPGYGAAWTPAQAFAISLDTLQTVWDNGTYHTPPGTPSGDFASWNYKGTFGTEGPSYDGTYGSDLRRFQATFDIPDGYTVTAGSLYAPHFTDGIPINDNVYIFINSDGTDYELLFWGGTRVYTGEIGPDFLDITGTAAARGTTEPVETDRWYIPGTIPSVTSFTTGTNTIDIFTEENERWGGMGKLVLELDYEQTFTETAWGEGERIGVTANWSMYFGYHVQELNLEGAWDVELWLNGVQYDRFIIITDQDGNVIGGNFGVSYPTPTGPIEGTITGFGIEFTYDPAGAYYAEFDGTISPDGNSMSGTWVHYNSGIPGPYWGQTWSATRFP